MTMEQEVFNALSEDEQLEQLRQEYESTGMIVSPETLAHWKQMKTATVTGQKAQRTTISIDLLYTVYGILKQVLSEVGDEAAKQQQIPFDGNCTCTKHVFLLPALNEISDTLKKIDFDRDKDLTKDLKYALKVQLNSQMKKNKSVVNDSIAAIAQAAAQQEAPGITSEELEKVGEIAERLSDVEVIN